MTVGILGSGFGLYGYLPALARMGERVVMPERYREKLRDRPDVCDLDGHIDWAADDEAVLKRCATLVVSRRPADQVRDVGQALARGTVKRFLLEKPLGPDPAAATSLFDALEKRGRMVRLGFIFAYAPWAQDLRGWIAGADDGMLDIVWRFRAHHHAANHETWKRHHGQGGGVLRFYGIHLIALLAELGYTEVTESRIEATASGEAETWNAQFICAGRPSCRVEVDSNADVPVFRVSGTHRHSPLITALADPFDRAAVQGGFDRRVEALTALCRSLLADEPPPPWYRASLALWAAAERRAAFLD